MTTNALPTTGTEVCLAKHREGEADEVTPEHFEVRTVEVPAPGEGEALVRTDYTQVVAVLLDLMIPGVDRNLPPLEVGQPLFGSGVGTVVASNSPSLAEGDLVATMSGFREYVVGPAETFWKLDPEALPAPYYHLGQGVTAHHGMVDVAEVGEGDVVYVSGAAGGVGSLAGQVAKCRGAAKVIGSAGSREKVEWLVDEVGYDAAFDYHDGPVLDRLREHAPDGISVFFDLVGGEQFEAAVQAAAQDARFALCGALSGQVGGTDGAFPRLDIMHAIIRQIVIKPFSTYHTPEQIWAWNEAFRGWVAEGRMTFPHTMVTGGLGAVPEAVVGLTAGRHKGAVIIEATPA